MFRSILFIGWYPNPNDLYKNVFFQNLVFAMADYGIRCTVISPVSVMKYRLGVRLIPKYMEQMTPNGNKVQVYYPRCFSASSVQLGDFNTEKLSEEWFEIAALSQAMKLKETFDAVYGHFFLYGGLAAIRIGNKLGIPSFVAFGECDYETQIKETYGDLKKDDIKGLSGVIAVSSKNARRLSELGIFDDIPISIVPNSVDHNLFKKMDKNECRRKLGLPIDIYIVGFVGGFIERKGDKRVLAAIKNLSDVYAAFAGTGERPPLGNNVVFCKKLKHEEVPVLLNAVDVFCLPTLSEGSCNAVAEALACGVPVISSNLDFNDDVLNDENSIRINPNSIEEIRNAIEYLRDNPSESASLARRGYEGSQKLSLSLRAKRILEFMTICCNPEANADEYSKR